MATDVIVSGKCYRVIVGSGSGNFVSPLIFFLTRPTKVLYSIVLIFFGYFSSSYVFTKSVSRRVCDANVKINVAWDCCTDGSALRAAGGLEPGSDRLDCRFRHRSQRSPDQRRNGYGAGR